MSRVGPTVSVKGDVRARGDLTIEGVIEGSVWCEDGAVTVASAAEVSGDVLARDVTVFGRADGQIVATDVIDIRPGAVVTGRLISKRLILNDGALVNGRAEPQHLEAAVRVARFQQQKRDAG